MGAKEQIALAALKALVPVLRQAVDTATKDHGEFPAEVTDNTGHHLATISHGLGILEAILEAI